MRSDDREIYNRLADIKTAIVLPGLETLQNPFQLIAAIFAILGIPADQLSDEGKVTWNSDQDGNSDTQSVLLVFVGISRRELESEAARIRTILEGTGKLLPSRVEVMTVVRPQELVNRLQAQPYDVVLWDGPSTHDFFRDLKTAEGKSTGQSSKTSVASFSSLPESARPRGIILSGCFESELANELNAGIASVIGLAWRFTDDLTIGFLTDFYRGLAESDPSHYETAFLAGCTAIDLLGMDDKNLPRRVVNGIEKWAVVQSGSLEINLIDPRQNEAAFDRTKKPDEALPPGFEDREIWKVWFGTNRRPKDPQNPKAGYGSIDDGKLHTGHCEVRIPEGHTVASGDPGWISLLLGLPHVRLLHIKLGHDHDSFAQKVREEVENGKEKCAVVFVHGFATTFEGAAIRAAQIGYDLRFPGVMAFFSWPSLGSTTARGYISDYDTAKVSAHFLAQFLERLKRDSGVKRIHLIAHSMGNLCLHEALRKVYAEEKKTDALFDQLVMAAADLDVREFQEYSANYKRAAHHRTRYGSKSDSALRFSKYLRKGKYDRVGLLGEMPAEFLPELIDTIDVSPLDMWLWGHSYYADAKDVVLDMYYAVLKGMPAAEGRGTIEPVKPLRGYWRIRR
jgi:esterase/lipase superfamily enzyme